MAFMNCKHLSICCVVLLTAGGFVTLELLDFEKEPTGPPKPASPTSTGEPSSNMHKAVKADSAEASALNLEEIDFDSIRGRFGGDYDPMIMFATAEFLEAEINAHNELHILPFNKAIGQTCRVEESELDPNGFAKVCEVVREQPPHPYKQLETTELVDLAQHDSTAALILGQRARDADERIEYYLRAVALSEKSGPLIALAQKRYESFIELKRAADGSLSNELRPNHLVNRLALESIAEQMGDPRANPDLWRERIGELDINNSSELLKAASAKTQTWLLKMRDIQRKITGSVQMEGILDA